MMTALLDTDIASEVLKGKNASVRDRARAYLCDGGRLTASAVTVMEITKGAQRLQDSARLGHVLTALQAFDVLPFERDDAEIAGQIYGDLERLGRPIGRADPMIAGTAIARALVLVMGHGALRANS